MAIAYKYKTELIPKQSIFYCSKRWCDRTFTTQFNCLHHEKTCFTTESTKMCNICQRTFSRRTHLKRHMKTHRSRSKYKCIKCQNSFQRKDQYEVHVSNCININENPGIIPTECGDLTLTLIKDDKSYLSTISSMDCESISSVVTNNMTILHGTDESFPIDVTLTHSNSLEIDASSSSIVVSNDIADNNTTEISKSCIQSNEGSKTCNVCNKSFTRRTNLRRHLMTHHIKVEYKCDKCQISYQSKDIFDIHVSTCGITSSIPGRSSDADDNASNDGITSYNYENLSPMVVNDYASNDDITSCDFGNLPSMVIDDIKVSHSSNILSSHSKSPEIDSTTTPSNNNIVPNSITDDNSTETSNLYIQCTTGSKTCNLCNKSFTRRTNLRRHLMTHRIKDEYKCNKCQMSYQRKDIFDIHVSTCGNASSISGRGFYPDDDTNFSSMVVNDCAKNDSTNSYDYGSLPSMVVNDNTGHIPSGTIGNSNLPSDIAVVHSSVTLTHGNYLEDNSTIPSAVDAIKQINPDNVITKTSKQSSVPKKRMCNVCKKTFTRNTNFRRHLMARKCKSQYKCKICQKVYQSKIIFDSHVERCINVESNDVLSSYDYENAQPILVNDVSNKLVSFVEFENLPTMLINENTNCIPIVIPSDYVNMESTLINANANNNLIINTDFETLPSMRSNNITLPCDVENLHSTDVKSLLEINMTNTASSDSNVLNPIGPDINNMNTSDVDLWRPKKEPKTCNICEKSFSRATNLRRHLMTHNNGDDCKPDSYGMKDEFDDHISNGNVNNNNIIHSTDDVASSLFNYAGVNATNPLLPDVASSLFNYAGVNATNPLLPDVASSLFNYAGVNATNPLLPDVASSLFNYAGVNATNPLLPDVEPYIKRIKATRTCNICKKVFSRTTTLKRHMITHQNKPNFKCDKCQNSYQRKATYLAHLPKCNFIPENPEINTSDCKTLLLPIIINDNDGNNSAMNSSDYKKQPVKGVDIPKLYDAPINNTLSPSDSLVANSPPPATTTSPADVTNNIAKNESNKTANTMNQSKIGTRTCNICKKIFSRSTTLRRHMLIHQNKPNYKCNRCQNCYRRKDTYISHLSKCKSITENPVENISEYGSLPQVIINGDGCKNLINTTDNNKKSTIKWNR